MACIFGLWKPCFPLDLKKGDEIYIFDPQSQPQVFRVIVDMVKWKVRKGVGKWDPQTEERDGILYLIPPNDAPVYDTTKSPMRLRNSDTFRYWAPANRIGAYGLEIEDITIIQNYDE